MRSLPTVLPLVVLGLALVADARGGSVWTVGPGGDFSDLPAAVTAAQSGDVIVVRTPSPGRLDLTGKSLTVTSDLAAPPDLRHPAADQFGNDMNFFPLQNRVIGVPAGGRVVLRGLRLYGLELDLIAGSVWIEECDVYGMAPALWVKNTASLNVVRSALAGPSAFFDPAQTLPDKTRGSAMVAVNAWMSIDHCTLAGGPAIDAVYCAPCAAVVGGANGGNGAVITGGSLYATASSFVGADGGAGLIDPSGACVAGGDGGNGMWLKGGAAVWHRDCAFSFGLGKPGFNDDGAGGCTPQTAPDGAPIRVEASSVVAVSEPARVFTLPSPIFATQVAPLHFEGAPGDIVLLTFHGTFSTTILPALKGAYLLKLPGPVVTAGVIPASGALDLPVPLPALPAGLDEASLTIQSAFCGSSGCHLGPGTRMTALAPGV